MTKTRCFLFLPLLLMAISAFARVAADDPSSSGGRMTQGIFVFPPDETFDEVPVPALPSGWANTHNSNNVGWITVASNAESQPNAAFAEDTNILTDKSLQTPSFFVLANSAVTFRHRINLESGVAPDAFDGAVLEISIAGGAFTDIVAAGGNFVSGGYDYKASSCCFSPLAGRPVWSGNNGGYETVVANLPVAAIGQNVMLRWRVATDFSGGVFGGGYWLDNIHIDTDVTFPPDEMFDELTAPNLPSGWVNNNSGPGPGWITIGSDAFSSPNAAFTDDTPSVSDKSLETPPFDVVANGRLTFRHKLDLESSDGSFVTPGDGVVLEIAIENGSFFDILDTGGSFVSGKYDNVTPEFSQNPLDGRLAWSGTSPGYRNVVVSLPASANGHRVRLRWRMGTDNSGGLTGYWLDDIHVDVNGPANDPIFSDDFQCLGGLCQ